MLGLRLHWHSSPRALGRAGAVEGGDSAKVPGAHVPTCELHPGPALATGTAWGQGGWHLVKLEELLRHGAL